MTDDLRYFEAVANRALANRSKRSAEEAQVRRQVSRATIGARVTTPPTDLSRLAAYLRVRSIREVALAMNARLMLDGPEIHVEVNAALPRFQKQFAVAHELAHLILEGPRIKLCTAAGQRLSSDARWKRARIERLCDLAAAEILLPLAWLRNTLRPSIPSLSFVEKMAEILDYDVEFVAIQILEGGLWKARLLWIETRKNVALFTRAHPPVDQAFLTSVRMIEGPDTLSFRDVVGKAGTVKGRLRLQTKDGTHAYQVECAALSNNIVLCALLHE